MEHIPWPGRLDLPGGARDPGETAVDCALREVAEEIGLTIGSERILWSRSYRRHALPSWLFAVEITASEARAMRLGDEGQWCGMMELDAYLAADDAIPHQQDRVRDALSALRP